MFICLTLRTGSISKNASVLTVLYAIVKVTVCLVECRAGGGSVIELKVLPCH